MIRDIVARNPLVSLSARRTLNLLGEEIHNLDLPLR
jgi:hypothetical protein